MKPNKGKDLGLVIMVGKPKKDDGMDDMGEGQEGDKDETGDHLACVPVNTLEEDGVAPEPGDKVTFTVDGKVEHVEGDKAYVSIEKVNGQDTETSEEEGEEKEPGEEDEENGDEGDTMDQLENAAKRQDKSRGFKV
jgi:hypothetical protein